MFSLLLAPPSPPTITAPQKRPNYTSSAQEELDLRSFDLYLLRILVLAAGVVLVVNFYDHFNQGDKMFGKVLCNWMTRCDFYLLSFSLQTWGLSIIA